MSIFKEKTALITGATGGIGVATAEAFAAHGCNLILVYRSEDKLKRLDNLYNKFQDDIRIETIKCDLSSKNDLNFLLNFTQNKDINILINNAGIFPIKDLLNSTEEDYEYCFDVNVKAPFLLAKVIGARMCQKGWGRILNVGSSSSYNGSENAGLYCASKHALLGLSRSFYKEFKSSGVRVFSISPGSAQTEMGEIDVEQDFSTFIMPEEIAKYICFALSFDAEGISEEMRINRIVIR